ncbi:hypothetical protein [Streptomyces sp. WAC06614]|uniref:hypothetical protein n=1 Tax=Streptomyces sp. WAC06614 TaxID=2487416 RepID=UPI000F7827D8|nr:hypothetical protein [Streptomyces sp. WAC06614]RSS68512.1 hypothetical protein EF918_28190 [Streptomyces sp. WAC06614]
MALSSGFDRNMPPSGVAQSSGAVDKCVNVQLMPFLAVLFVGVILVLAPAQFSSLLLVLPMVLAAARRSSWSRRSARGWSGVGPAAVTAG